MNAAIWILFGLIAGIVGHVSDTMPVKGGIVGSVAAGIVGALGGGWLASYLFSLNTRFDLPSFIIAVSFSVLVVFMYRIFFMNKIEY